MNELEKNKRIIKVIKELESLKYDLIEFINNKILKLEEIIKG